MKVLLQAGRRNGRSFDNEQEFIDALSAGDEVYVTRNGVYFEVQAEGDGVRYVALPAKPDDL